MTEPQRPSSRGSTWPSWTGWDIVVAADALPSEAYAAEEFRSIFAQATGIDLPIVTTSDSSRSACADRRQQVAGRRVSPTFDVAAMGPEDLRIIVRDNLIAIAGGRPRGTLYGVYTFLEDYLGVRFLTADHTHIPKLTGKVVVGPLDRTYSPPLSFRWSYYGETNRSPMLAARLRVNTVGGDDKVRRQDRPVAHQPLVRLARSRRPNTGRSIPSILLCATASVWQTSQTTGSRPNRA